MNFTLYFDYNTISFNAINQLCEWVSVSAIQLVHTTKIASRLKQNKHTRIKCRWQLDWPAINASRRTTRNKKKNTQHQKELKRASTVIKIQTTQERRETIGRFAEFLDMQRRTQHAHTTKRSGFWWSGRLRSRAK